jgi:hypothetical protein
MGACQCALYGFVSLGYVGYVLLKHDSDDSHSRVSLMLWCLVLHCLCYASNDTPAQGRWYLLFDGCRHFMLLMPCSLTQDVCMRLWPVGTADVAVMSCR